MSPILRKIIFIFFVCSFFATAFFVLLYANGYRYDVRNHFLQKTGQLIVETKPREARITLDGRPAHAPWSRDELVTPATVQYILSGEYVMSLQKKGFHEWRQRITIEQGKTTIRNDIALFRDMQASLVGATPSLGAAYSTQNGLIFYSGHIVFFFDERTSEVSTRATAPEPITELFVSPSGKRFVVVDEKNWHFFENGKRIFSAPKKHISFRWDNGSDDVYAFDDHSIYRFDAKRMVLSPLITITQSSDVFVDVDIYVLQKGTQTILRRFSKATGELQKTITNIPTLNSFIRGTNGMILLSGGRDTLYLFDKANNRPIFQQIVAAHDMVFSDSEHFFSYNDFEIWSHANTANHYERSLVTRQSQRITQMVPFRTMPYLVLVSENKEIHVRDNHSGEYTTDVVLATFDSISNIFLNKSEATLFIFGSQNGKIGLFSLPIIEQDDVFPLVK